jgi:hypothetical protein
MGKENLYQLPREPSCMHSTLAGSLTVLLGFRRTLLGLDKWRERSSEGVRSKLPISAEDTGAEARCTGMTGTDVPPGSTRGDGSPVVALELEQPRLRTNWIDFVFPLASRNSRMT